MSKKRPFENNQRFLRGQGGLGACSATDSKTQKNVTKKCRRRDDRDHLQESLADTEKQSDMTAPLTAERLEEIQRNDERRARTMGPHALPIYAEARELLREVERLRPLAAIVVEALAERVDPGHIERVRLEGRINRLKAEVERQRERADNAEHGWVQHG